MITTVTLNPCNDRTLTIERFAYGGMNRVKAERFDAAGKGFNVARALSRLGADATATGFLFDENGGHTHEALLADGVREDCVWTAGRVRTNIKLLDAHNCVVTEINESGMPITPALLDALLQKIEALSAQSEYLTLSGSLPPRCPADVYARIIEAARCPCALDAEGASLALGIEQKPWLVKPNRFELETFIKKDLPTLADVAQAALSLVRSGAQIACVTLGAGGSLITDGTTLLRALPITGLPVRGTVGAGDSLLAGLLLASNTHLPLAEMLRYGAAAAAACAAQEGTGLPTAAGLAEYLPQVEVITIQPQ